MRIYTGKSIADVLKTVFYKFGLKCKKIGVCCLLCYVCFTLIILALFYTQMLYNHRSNIENKDTAVKYESKGNRQMLNDNNISNIEINTGRRNLIYYGSYRTIAAMYNTPEKLREFQLPGNSSLVRRFPQVICIGVPKAGTSALRYFLGHHPSIITSLIDEPKYFTNRTLYNSGFDSYLNLMKYSTKDQITFEKTPGYFSTDLKLKRIHDFDQSVRILLVVKDPVERSLSHYVHFIKRKNKSETFQDVFLTKGGKISTKHFAVRASLYGEIYKKCRQFFNKEQIYIVNGDTFVKNPSVELQKIEKFIGIPNYFNSDTFYFNQDVGFYCLKLTQRGCTGNTKDDVFNEIKESVNIDIDAFKQKLSQFFMKHNHDNSKFNQMMRHGVFT